MNTKSADLGRTLKAIGLTLALGASGLSVPAAAPPTHMAFRAVQTSYSIIGKKVLNSRDQTLGTVIDMALDLENGRLVEAIVSSSSGFLGLGQRTVAVPPGALVFDLISGVIRLDMDKELFKVAPELDLANWAEHTQSRRVAEVYRYYGQDPYFAADGKGSSSGNTSFEPLGYVQRMSKLGLPVKNLQDEELGKVVSVQCVLASGYVSHVIVQTPGFAQAMSVIQARALKFNAARDGLLLDVSKQAFKEEPRFKWTYDNKGDFKQESFVNRAVAANDGFNTKQNVQAGIASTYTPLAQGSNFRDVDKTYRIYAAMRADASLSQSAQDVEVGTLNGQTTLRGNVNTVAGKRTIGEIAAGAGRPENVSNLLEVRAVPAAN